MREIFSKIKAGLKKWTTQSTGISDPVNHKRIMAMSNEEVINEFNTTVDTAVITWSQEKIVFHHPFWQDPNFIRALDFETTQKVLNLIEAYAVHYPQMVKFASDTELLNNLGLQWSRPSHFQSIQTHIFENLSPQNKHTLMPRINAILSLTWSYKESPNAWLVNAENFLFHGGTLSWAMVASALYYNHATDEHNPKPVSSFPRVMHEFNTKANDDLLMGFSTAGMPETTKKLPPSTWLSTTHPQANAWRLGDNPRMKYQLENIARSLLDKELFKAWHGIELSPKEALNNPNAQLLYAHKHMLLPSKSEPLPATWSAALALANTGMQFKEMLQMYEHTPSTGPNFSLPDMSV